MNYPDRPIRLIAPFPPGGGTGDVARVIAQALSTRLGQAALAQIALPQGSQRADHLFVVIVLAHQAQAGLQHRHGQV